MPDPIVANQIHDPGPVAPETEQVDADGPRLRLAGTHAGPLNPTVERLLEFRSELLAARALILEDAGFIRRRLERSGRVDAMSRITGEDAFDGVATRIDHEISRLDLELARLEETVVSIETDRVVARQFRRDS